VLAVGDSLRAGLELTGITGLRYIELDNVGPEYMLLHPPLTFEPPHKVIPSKPGGFEEIEQALRDVYEKLMAVDTEGISHRTKLLLDSGISMTHSADSLFNDKSFTAWADKLDRTISNANNQISQLDFAYYDVEIETTLREIREGSVKFNSFLAELESQSKGMRIDQHMNKTFENIDRLIATSSGMLNKFNYQSSQVMATLNTTLLALNETIAELNSLVISMESYPSNVFYAAPPPKEK